MDPIGFRSESIVARVQEVRALDIWRNQTVTRHSLRLWTQQETCDGVAISPDLLNVVEPISLLGGFRYVIVKAVTVGQVANGYKLTNIYVTPAGVVVFSSDPQLVNELPGYVETQPVDLIDADDDFEVLVDLNVPEGISIVGDPKVLVQVSIARSRQWLFHL
jgi:YbbR domain-containing protein